ncbi:MAG: exopolysaccharide biosynthesis protein [Elusimicrobia bacterium]|nr:exopolysaccharide biosynthesis protein [Elusimicrobiota bacterium]
MAAAAHLSRLRAALDGPLTLGELSERLGRDGIGLLAVLLSVPFLQPIPLAGLGTPVGVVLMAAGVQLALGHERMPLPGFAARRRLDPAHVAKALGAAERILTALERYAKPRWRGAARLPRAIGAAIVVLGSGFALPVFVPLGNPVSAVAMVLLGLALLEEDGLLAVAGLTMAALSTALHLGFFFFLWTGGRGLFGPRP